jgi:catechol 2,3-dioxygenase-like lactoylglutathione lyase family enzyme
MKSWQLVGFSALAFVTVLFAHGQTANARPQITGVSHLSVYAADPAKTDDFYQHDLGAFKTADPENPAGVRFYFSPVQFIEVLPLPPGYTSIDRLVHTAFNTSDVEGLRSYMGAHGIAVPAGLQSGSDGSRWFEVNDPEGNKVQFVQPPAAPPAIPPNTLSNHIIHVGYLVHNAAAENAFYREILGFRPYWYGGSKPGVPSWISQQVPDGTDWIEYMMVSGPETTGIPASVTASSLGTMDHFALGVQNMEKAAELLYAGNRISEKSAGPKIGLDGKWQYNLYSADGTRAELMEFQPVVKPCCSDFTAASPTH